VVEPTPQLKVAVEPDQPSKEQEEPAKVASAQLMPATE